MRPRSARSVSVCVTNSASENTPASSALVSSAIPSVEYGPTRRARAAAYPEGVEMASAVGRRAVTESRMGMGGKVSVGADEIGRPHPGQRVRPGGNGRIVGRHANHSARHPVVIEDLPEGLADAKLARAAFRERELPV